MPSVFISHNWKDKRFVRRLAKRFVESGVVVWLDEVELKIGDSLVNTISDALAQVDFVAAVISQNSIASPWVTKEISLAMSKEVDPTQRVVLPVRIDDCVTPPSLRDKLYADFRRPHSFENECTKLLNAMGVHASRDKYPHGLSVEWTPEGPRIIGNGVVLSPSESSAILGRYTNFWPQFIKEQEQEIGKGNPMVGPRAHIAAVLRSCFETYGTVPAEEDMARSQTELARKFDLFHCFIEVLFVDEMFPHRKGELKNRRIPGSLHEDTVGPKDASHDENGDSE